MTAAKLSFSVLDLFQSVAEGVDLDEKAINPKPRSTRAATARAATTPRKEMDRNI